MYYNLFIDKDDETSFKKSDSISIHNTLIDKFISVNY